jgi:DNA recombination protein RmuC
MMQMEILLWSVAAALAAGIIVFAVMARGRRVLQDEAAAARSASAVAESRLVDLTAAHATLAEAHRRLNDEHLNLSRERERLSATLEKVGHDLQREAEAARTSRGQLDETARALSQLESDHRVAVSQNRTLAERVAALEASVSKGDEENRRHGAEIAQLRALAAGLEKEREGLTTRLAEQKAWVEEQTRFLEQKIANVAGQILEEKSKAFTELNRKELDAVVTPFKEQLGEFRQRVDSIYAADSRDRGQLVEQVAQLARLNQAVSQRAEELTKALTISSKATGDWGEMILEKILEDSGLREGQEYTLQHTVTAADAEALQRPDAVVFLPEQRQVVIDSKVSNKAWTEYCAATDDESRAAKLAEHLASLRTHIRGLSARDYPSSPDLQTVDFVLMFVPVEAALLTALARDGSLYTDAYRSKIILVTPSTLMAVLKLIEGMWAFQKRKESADKIAEAGRKLYEKLTVFANTFVEIGAAIEKAQGTFARAKGQLADGRGNVIKLARQMVELGVRVGPGKVMPAGLIERSGDEADEDIEAPGPAGPESEDPGAP